VEASGARLGFEITETSVIGDPESAIVNLNVFAAIGIVIAIDDYGAGLSSLAYLKQLPARELKIDKLFVTQLTSSNRDPLIVRSTIDLAHALEMEVVAEGVETQAAMALLSVMGCDMIQGFLISRPINLDALIHFMEDGNYQAMSADLRAPFNRLATVWKRG
jgi:EAL domain-containing protein (putative c-di-GMP-specific phosphodiesterase class I)